MGDPSCSFKVLPSPLTATLYSQNIIRPAARRLHLRNLRENPDSGRWRSYKKSSAKAVKAQSLPFQRRSSITGSPLKHVAERCKNRTTRSPVSPRRLNRPAAPAAVVYCSHSQLFGNLSAYLHSSTALLSKATDLLTSASHAVPLLDIDLVASPSSTLTHSISNVKHAIDSVWMLGQQVATAGIQILSQLSHLSSSEFAVGGSSQFLGDLAVALESYSGTLGNPTASVPAILISVAGSAIAVSSLRNRTEFRDVWKASDSQELTKLMASRDALFPHQYRATSNSLTEELQEGDFLPAHYDPEAMADYFSKRPFLVLSRATRIMAECSFLITNILLDLSAGKMKENESLRAAQLVAMIERLGPTALKIGQALSIRPDILPATYLLALQKLQDKVYPFSYEEAKHLILEELGQAVDEIYSEFSAEPFTAASLGQVYRAKLRISGEAVAVKVQRPQVLEAISLDLYILRAIAKGAERFPNMISDLLPLLDHGAVHFFHELDYRQEAKNAEEFGESMKCLPNVMVPKARMQYTSRKVLTTTWVEGEKLSECEEEDPAKFVSTCLNCFLIQILESGFLHADPHLGNLLRTPDGRLCVLNFGSMIRVTEDQRYALIDYISHLISEDYEKVAEDLIRLGFVPPDVVDQELTETVLPQVSRVLSQLVQGGDLQQIDFQQIIDELAGMVKDYPIVIPPYFALILQAFSMLEGIGLKSNPNYAIVEECYPYISKRLLTDDSPRARAALKYFLYGDKEQLDVQRIEAIFTGLTSFNKSMTPTAEMQKSKLAVPSMDFTSKELLSSLFAPEGSFVQELLLTELVRVVDALSREALFELWNGFSITIFPFAHFLPTSYWPSPMQSLFFGATSVSRISDEDETALKLVGRLLNLVSSQLNHQAIADMTVAARSVPAMIPDLASGFSTASLRFLLMLLHRKALRLADDLDGKNSLMYWNRDPIASARHVKPFTFTSTSKYRRQLKP